MPLLRKTGVDLHDHWQRLNDDEALPANPANSVISLTRLLSVHTEGLKHGGAVIINPEDDVYALQGLVQQLKLVCISFPAFTDGRGYSHARILRKRLNYENEIRAVGDIRLDQIAFMARTGIDSFELQQHPDETMVDTLTARFTTNYQPSYQWQRFSASDAGT